MAKVKIMGNAVQITSSLKFDDIKALEAYKSDCLTDYGADNLPYDEPVFKIGTTTDSYGRITEYGASFGGKTADGFATISIFITETDEDPAGYVAENLGASLAKLNALEAKLPPVIEKMKSERQAVLESIEIV